MPTFAEMIFAQAADQTDPSKTTYADNFVKGAQLAIENEKLQQSRMQLQQKQRELQNAKVDKLYEFLGNARHYTNSSDRNNYLKSAIGYRNILGLSPDEIPDSGILSLGSDENMGRAYTLHSMVEREEISAAEALDLATNPMKRDKFAQIIPTPAELMNKSPDLTLAQKEVLDRENAKQVAAISAQAAADRQSVDIGSKGTIAADQSFGKEYTDYKATGGFAEAEKNLQKLRESSNWLKTGKAEAGSYLAAIPWGIGEKLTDLTDEQLASVRDNVRGAIQGTLKQVLGGQYTEREGEAIFNRAFNPVLSSKENARRIDAEIVALTKRARAREAAMQYFEATGTLRGFGQANPTKASNAKGKSENATPTKATKQVQLSNGKYYALDELRKLLPKLKNKALVDEIKAKLQE